MNCQMIDFNSHIPYYFQLMEVLKRKISSGEWQVGDQLPSEPDLCQLYGVSRTVVRNALREMEFEGLISRRKGKGTFVAGPKIVESLAQRLTGFYQDMIERGHQPVSKILHHEVIPANQKVADYLQIELGTAVYDIKRLRFVNDEPIVLVRTYLPRDLCPQLENVDLSNRSLYAFLENECSRIIAYGKRTLEAVLADEEEAGLLQTEPGAALILLDSVSYLEDGTPIEYFHALHRGDRSRFEVQLVRFREQGKQRDAILLNEEDLPSSN